MKRLATVNQMAELYPSFTQSAIRWLIFNEKINGFTKCLRRIGRRVLIDLDDFEHWIDMQQASGGAK
ncbi:MAG: DNA-binding protein [Gammaproteobacteria bacterium]|nr:DNA-binding protein [Gammaproteobacteria bacterium]